VEKDLSRNFKKEWEPNYYERIEPKACTSGIPDVLLVVNEVSFFIELKYEKKKFINKKLKIRESQKIWFLKFPGIAFFLFQVEDKYYLFDKDKTMFLTQTKVKWQDFVNNAEVFSDLKKVKIRIGTLICMKILKISAICS